MFNLYNAESAVWDYHCSSTHVNVLWYSYNISFVTTRHRRTASLAKTLLCEEEKQAFYLVSVMAVVNQVTIMISRWKLVVFHKANSQHTTDTHSPNTRINSINVQSKIFFSSMGVFAERKCLKIARVCLKMFCEVMCVDFDY